MGNTAWDADMVEIWRIKARSMSGARDGIAIIETGGGWEVHQWGSGGIWPVTTYRTKRLAGARALQLLGIGPVAPQSHPEIACIGTVQLEPADLGLQDEL